MLDFFNAYSGWGMWVLQFAVGAIFIVHGWQKLKNPGGIASVYHMPNFVGLLHGAVEVLGGLALILGVYMREAGLVLALIMLGAIYFKAVKWKTPFMAVDRPGWEFDFVLLAANLYFLLG